MSIHKGGDKEEPLNHRPGSLTSVVAKMCEKIVKDKWLKFLEETNTLSGGQFGFRGGSSFIMNLLSFYSSDWCDRKEKGGLNASTCTSRRLLTRYLTWDCSGNRKCSRIEGWFAEMDGRLFEQQRNENSNKRKKSEWCSVKSGVPQGSVLAPMMFLVYVNDMTEGVNSYMSICRWCQITKKNRK